MKWTLIFVAVVIGTAVLGVEAAWDDYTRHFKVKCSTGVVSSEHCRVCPCDTETGLLKTEECYSNDCNGGSYEFPGCSNSLRTLCRTGQLKVSPEGKRCECAGQEWFCEEETANMNLCSEEIVDRTNIYLRI